VPPYENYFGVRNAMLWAEWIDSDGAAGVEPPQWAKDMIDDINALQSAAQGTPEFEQLANDLVSAMVENMMFIGTVNAPAPIYQQNKLKNFADFKTHSYEYYRTYPYRASQWWLDE
jgi:peptide/nickel transport system substrate-binding protein